MSALPEWEDVLAEPPGSAAARQALERYAEPLLRRTATRCARQRLGEELDDLRERIIESLGNPVVIDRSLKTLSPAARRLLRLVGASRQPRWRVEALVDASAAIGDAASIEPIRELLEAGLAFPHLPARGVRLSAFDIWLAAAPAQPLKLTIAPLAAVRASREPFPNAKVDFDVVPAAPVEADGLEWPLRIAVVWQFVRDSPLRLTQQGEFFKRDLDRLRAHPLLSAPPAEQLVEIPDAGLLAVEIATALGVLARELDQIRAVEPAPLAPSDLAAILTEFWSAVGLLENWDPMAGWVGGGSRPIVGLAAPALTVLADLPEDQWALADDVDALLSRSTTNRPGRVAALLLGLLHQLRLVQAAKHRERWWVRLSPAGRAIATGQQPRLPPPPIEQTLVVQPNLEVIVYRQGLTPAVIWRLTRIAEWRSLGLACTLGLSPESVYRGLEAGESLAELLTFFERHSARPLSETVLDSLRSWASKRERVRVYSSACLLEFPSPADLDLAIRRGLVEQRITERIGLVRSEDRVDLQEFRLTGTRDYLAGEDICIDVRPDGLTLAVNENRSDLLLDSELRRIADPVEGAEPRIYRMTLESLRAARAAGLDAAVLDAWFQRRAGQSLPAPARLLLTADTAPPFALGSQVLLRVPAPELADGLAAWPESAAFLGERVAPTIFVVAPDHVEPLRALLERLGVTWGSA